VTRAGKARAAGAAGAADSAAGYAEDHCALDAPLLATGIYVPVLAIAFFAAALVAQIPALSWAAIGIVFLTAAWWAAGGGSWLRYVWPAGIRLDQTGVRIGGVSWAERHPGQVRKRMAIVPRQYSQVFSCPWIGVRSIGVTTDREAIRTMKQHAYRGRRPTPLGNLAAPYMRAALVIWIDQDQAQLPAIRPATNMVWSNYPAPGFHQPIWVVPTRRPGQLAAALALLPLPSGTVRDPRDLFSDDDSPVGGWSAP
jgi:hypothetical protein